MSDRIHFPNDTRLTTDMLNSSFDYLELADQRVLSDLGIAGIVAGLNVTASQDDLGICVSPGIAYDRLGRRIKVDTLQLLDLTSEIQEQITATNTGKGQISILVKFSRREANTILDRWGRTVAQQQLESYTFVVQSCNTVTQRPSEAPAGENDVLICDVKWQSSQKVITEDNIDFSRRSYPVVWRAARIGTDGKKWKAVEPATTVQEALDHVDAAIGAHCVADKVSVNARPGRWEAVMPAITAQEALDHIDRAIYEGSMATGIAVNNASWQALQGCGDAQEALGCLDRLATRQVIFQCSTENVLSQVKEKLKQLGDSPREFAARLHAVVVFHAAVALHAIAPGVPQMRQVIVRGIKKGDVVLSIAAISSSPSASLAFEAVEAFADNFVQVRVATLGKATTPETKVQLRVIAAVASPRLLGTDEFGRANVL